MGRMVDVDDLIDSRAVADLLGLAHLETVHQLRKRHPDFPAPAVSMGLGRCMLWVRSDVTEWAAKRRP
jgi:predicted DNA-binding transcriptional regulator AlpA